MGVNAGYRYQRFATAMTEEYAYVTELGSHELRTRTFDRTISSSLIVAGAQFGISLTPHLEIVLDAGAGHSIGYKVNHVTTAQVVARVRTTF